MLIRRAELDFGVRVADLRIESGAVREIAPRLTRRRGEETIDAVGGALLPALRDHHLHLYALAAARTSVCCGPPQVTTAQALVVALQEADARLEAGAWLRGTGFHESVMAGSGLEATRNWLDSVVRDRPLRIQHRSGRLWLLNGAALQWLGVTDAAADDPLERINGRCSGRLFDADGWLRARVGGLRPALATVSRELWDLGVIAVTDAGHGNDLDDFRALAAAQARGELLQDVLVMGSSGLDVAVDGEYGRRRLMRGARKFHLHEHALPPFETFCEEIRRAHDAGRDVAFHCVSRVELVFALAGLREAGTRAGDRVEHAGIVPPELAVQLAALDLCVVTQPGFIAERGDRYRREVAAEDRPWLYRLRGLLDAGVPLALSSDAPYASANPWATLAAAVDRRAPDGAVMNPGEALNLEQAFGCMTTDLRTPGEAPARIEVGAPADLCLLPLPWQAARLEPAALRPVATWCRGRGTGADDCDD